MSSLAAMETIKVDGRSLRAAAKRVRTRQQILEGAKKVFATRGYHGASISALIEGCGVARGTFYLYFDSKDAIFKELLESFVEQLIAAVEVVGPESPDPAGQLLLNIRRLVDLFFNSRHLSVVLMREAIGLSPEVDETLNRLHAFWHEMLVGALVNGAEWGLTRKVNEPVVATAVIGAAKEILYQFLVVEERDNAASAQVAQALYDFCLRGLLPNRT